MAAAAAPPQGFPKKPRSSFPEQTSHIQQIPSKSHSNTLCKTSIIVVLLLAIPLFPSQAPDFITQTIFTESWEIIHLLFIGIAISYGLFGRRTPQINRIVDSCVGDDDSSSYLPGISHLHSIFDDGYEITCGGDEQENFLGKGSARVEDGNGEIVNQTWSSKYSKEKSLVVVSNGKYFVDGSPDFKPLNLPVRSLRSNAVIDELRNGIESSSRSEAHSNDDHAEGVNVVRFRGVRSLRSRGVDDDSSGLRNRIDATPRSEANSNDDDDKVVRFRGVRSLRSRGVDDDSSGLRNRIDATPRSEANCNDDEVVRIRGVVPINLEKKFDEVAGRSSIPWRSRSWRARNGDETSRPVHNRPHSVGEFEFEHLKLSGSPELGSRKVERRRVFKHPHPKVAPVNVEASFDGPKKRPFSNDASSDTARFVGLENSQKNLVQNSVSEEELGKGKRGIECSDVDKKSPGVGKVSSRAKSVRTIKPNRHIKNRMEHSLMSRIDGELERMCTNSETGSESGEEAENHQNEDVDRVPKAKPTLAEFHKEEKHDLDELDKSSVDDRARANVGNESELEGSEVDRKAGEFIAKFREQIRLQKTS